MAFTFTEISSYASNYIKIRAKGKAVILIAIAKKRSSNFANKKLIIIIFYCSDFRPLSARAHTAASFARTALTCLVFASFSVSAAAGAARDVALIFATGLS